MCAPCSDYKHGHALDPSEMGLHLGIVFRPSEPGGSGVSEKSLDPIPSLELPGNLVGILPEVLAGTAPELAKKRTWDKIKEFHCTL